MILSREQILYYCSLAGFSGDDLNRAADIAFCESSYNTLAHNTSGEDSRGLFQINVASNIKYKDYDLYDPLTNCQVAYELYSNRGGTFKDWSCNNIIDKSTVIAKNFSPIILFFFIFLILTKV